MTTQEIIEKIRSEIERRKEEAIKNTKNNNFDEVFYSGKSVALGSLLSFLSDLEKEEKPINQDDAMKELDEKIALVKQRGTWDGVDVDKYMDEVRGRDPEKPMELDFERELYKHFGQVKDFTLGMRIGQHFYELGCRRTAEKYDEIEYKRQRADVCEGLEEEAVSYCFDNGLNLSPMVATDIARHFAEWQKEKDNEVADKALTTSIKLQEGWYARGIADGEKSMKEKMMKEAVEGEVYSYHSYNRDATAILVDIPKENLGDKVCIIVCKKED